MTTPPDLLGEAHHAPFDLYGELPQGSVVLEASAGTGKTFTIAGLAARYVAQGQARLDQLMIVTFGRAATDELRERVRDRLVSLQAGLAAAVEGRPEPINDELFRLLRAVDPHELRLRRDRVRRAVASFDSATITTTHGMCEMLLRSIGLVSNRDPEARLVEDATDLVEQVASDVYLKRYAFTPQPFGPVPLHEVLRLGADVAGNPDVVLEPQVVAGQAAEQIRSGPEQRAHLANSMRAGLNHRRRLFRLMDFDDLLSLTAGALADPELGELACTRIRDRYQVVLVDEFQDTDPLQWDVLRRVFHGHRTLVLVGDPKQAIYGFRGGDVETYLAATRAAMSAGSAPLDLIRNHRSDPGVVAGVEALLRTSALGNPSIRVRQVQAAWAQGRLTGPDVGPVELRWFSRADLGSRPGRVPATAAARAAVVTDVVGQVAATLDGTRRFEEDGISRPLEPADIAVLVRTNAQGESVQRALQDAGIPAVMHSTSSVFATRGAREWLTLLEAIERPRDTSRVRAAALGIFGGWSAAELAAADDAAVEPWRSGLRRWARLLETRGVAALLEHLISSSGVQGRALGTPDGERLLTDLRHVGEILHGLNVDRRWGALALVGWLSRQIRGAPGSASRSRRLDSDAKAVQVVTIHRSKGLEFPVVLIPFGWDRYDRQDVNVLRYHADGQRRLHVGGRQDPGYAHAEKAARAEELGEELRLLYVALTRASAQVILWWAPSHNTPTSAVQRVLFGNPDPTGVLPDKVVLPPDDELPRRLDRLTDLGIRVSQVRPDSSAGADAVTALRRTPAPQADLQIRSFTRPLDPGWRRTSYSGITAGAHASSTPAASLSEPDDAPDIDEPQTTSPMAGLPAGPVMGTYVHAVLETVDTAAADLRQEMVDHARAVGSAAWAAELELDPQELADALLPVMHTPLGPFTRTAQGELTLADVAPADRLSELVFEFPLAGGDDARQGSGARVADIADCLERHLHDDGQSASASLADYPRRLREAGLGSEQLRGYLNGSIDSVVRLRDPQGGVRYVVVDYKTNWLGQWDGQPLTAHDYRQEAMAQAMMDSHYPLQAALYSVALHRFLAWRQPEYDPARHLGGTLYLFLRGMVGQDAPRQGGWCSGVFGWRPSAELVQELSLLLGNNHLPQRQP